MKTNLKYLVALFTLLFVSVACDNDDDNNSEIVDPTPTKNIVEIASETESLSSLVAALTLADKESDSDLIGTLSGDGPFTVFAPTNSAFNNLLAQLEGYDNLSDFDTPEGRQVLATVLQYHVVVGAGVTSSQLSDNQEITTVQGESLMVDLSGGVYIEDATDMSAMVSTADVMATNGVIHVIDKVLLPQEVLDMLNEKTLVEIVSENEEFSILEAVVVKTGLVETLNSDGSFTVFAPTNDAFAALLEALGDDYNSLDDFDTEAEIDLLRNIVLYHALAAEVYAADLSEMEVETAYAGNNIGIVMSGDTYVIQDATEVTANIVTPDIMASNGVAHVIDKVLLPQAAVDAFKKSSLVEIVVGNENLSILEDVVIKTGLVETLSGEGPFTVFAPTNDAFVALLEVLGDDYNSLDDFDTEAEMDLLRNIVLYHAVPGEIYSSDLTETSVETVFTGNSISVVMSGDTYVIQDATGANANIIQADVMASNGVAHVIDKVLLPN